jgi:nitrogen fixation protein FixH
MTMTMTTTTTAPSGGLTGRKVFLILACFFGTVASADTLLVLSALRTWSGTEATSAYKAGQLYKNELALARSQDARGWKVSLSAEREPDGAVRLTAAATDAEGRPLTGRTLAAVLQRPTDQKADRKAALVEGAAGSYVAVMEDVAPGQWDLVVDVLDGSEREYRRRTRIVLR